MATINKTIEMVDNIRPNTFSPEDKFAWLAAFDGMVSRVVMQQDEPVEYEYPKDMDTQLLIPAPFGGVYALYLEAQVALHQNEIEEYNNIVAVFDTRFSEYKKAYIRANMPKSAGSVKNL